MKKMHAVKQSCLYKGLTSSLAKMHSDAIHLSLVTINPSPTPYSPIPEILSHGSQ